MCTVTIVPTDSGARLTANRDELRTRAAASPPSIHTLAHARAAYPVDPVGPGTWVGANDRGLVVTLLNRSGAGASVRRRQPRSRGLIIPALLECETLSEAIDAAARLRPREYQAFRLVLLQLRSRPRRSVHVETASIVSDTQELLILPPQALRVPTLFTSSSLGDAWVEGPRRALFERMFARGPARWLDAQRRFHAHQWRARSDISVRMARGDARTVSRTQIDVRPGAIVLRYLELGEHRPLARATVSLEAA